MRASALCSQISIIAALALASAGCAEPPSEAIAQTPAVPSLEYLDSWGVKGNEPGQLQDPSSIAVNGMSDVFITNIANGFVNKFERGGKPLLSFQEDGLNHPQMIVVDDGGAMYVADSVRDSVYIFLPSGDKYKELHLKTKPSAENELSVAVGDDGLIHVLDSGAGKVFTFTPRAKVVQTWAPSGGSNPISHFGPIVHGPDDFLYVGNSSGTILKYTREGQFVSEIRPASPIPSWKTSAGFAFWSNRIIVMDPDGRMLHVATMDGKPVIDADLAPQLGQGRRQPPMLAVTTQGELLVLDPLETRVLHYRIKL
jgi:streptogramin lyase